MSASDATLEIPLSLYVHWPWCVRKCPYCDFNSHALNSRSPEEAEGHYVEALTQELTRQVESFPMSGRAISTVFIGGGTPSLMSPESIDRLLRAVDKRVGLSANAEVTLEANPGTVERGKFEDFRAAGINRLSIGVQSFQDDKLKVLGRIHSGDEALQAIRLAASAFDNFNLDFMFGLPNETLAELTEEVKRAVGLGATHLSFYQLTIEEGTAFAKRLPAGLPDEDKLADMTDLVESMLAQAGYEHYEVSGYARAGRRCQHNLNYWTYGDYLAIGAGAHAKLSARHRDGTLKVVRYANVASPRLYLERMATDGFAYAEHHEVDPTDRPFEFMLNALRLVDGVETASFAARTGLSLEVVEPTVSRLRAEGLLVADPTRIAPSARGLRFLSTLQEAFL